MDPVTSNTTFVLPVTRSGPPVTIVPQVPAAPLAPPTQPETPSSRAKKKARVVKPLSAYLDYLPPTQQLTPAQKAALEVEELKLLVGPTARVPLLCKGIQCPFIEHCSLAKAQVPLPLDRDCPVESFAIESWKAKFLDDIEIDKNENSASIVALVDDLAVEVAMQTRILWRMGKEADPIQKTVMGMNHKGQPLEIQQLNPVMDYLLRVHDRKLKKLRELLVTPRAKAEAGRLGFSDPASKASSAQAAASEILKNMDGPTAQISKLGDFTKRGSD